MSLKKFRLSASVIGRVSRLSFLTGFSGVALLAVYGRFDDSPRGLHQLAWGLVAVGCFLWMATDSKDEPNRWRGACKALLGYGFLGSVFLYPILMSDGDFYYGVIRSILWERDTNTMDEGARYAHGWLVEQAGRGGPYGFPHHPFPIGAGLSWIPFIAAGHVEAVIRRIWTPRLPLDGYSAPYLNWIAVGTAAWGGVFVFFGYLLLRLRFSHSISLRAVLGGLVATPAFYYCFRDCGFPHAHAMAALAFFFWVWLQAPGCRDSVQLGLLAVALSAAALVRWQNCLFAAAPVLYWLGIGIREEGFRGVIREMKPSLLLGFACLVLCFPQIVFFRMRGPSWLALEHGGGAWFWTTPRFFSLCFDPKYGLWYWHPFYFLSALGVLLYVTRKGPFWKIPGIGWVLFWVYAARRGETDPFWAMTGLGWFLGAPLVVFAATLLKKPYATASEKETSRLSLKPPVSLLFFCGGLELYIDASYIYYHGAGEYGNRLAADLLGLALPGFAWLLHQSRRAFFSRYGFALVWTSCLAWSLAVLHKGSPKLTRSPRYLTEILSHGTPVSSVVQGAAHLDWRLAGNGLWLFISVALSLVVLAGTILILRGLWLQGQGSPARILSSVVLGSLLCSLWFRADLGSVDAALYLDNRDPDSVLLVRQAFNPELTPWFPPGREADTPDARLRFHRLLTPETPRYSTLLPVTWDEKKQARPYIVEKMVILSRVWADRPLPYGEPIAEVRLGRRFPSSRTDWTIRAGIDTDLPTSLRLPPSASDWYGWDVSSIPRYFVAELAAAPTQEMDFLEISLIPEDVTLELGAIWFSRPMDGPSLTRAENPKYRRITVYDQRLFGSGEEYFDVPFPPRWNPRVARPETEIFGQPNRRRLACRFRYFRDPWRLFEERIPMFLRIDNPEEGRLPGWHVLDRDSPEVTIDLSAEPAEALWIALAASPAPEKWNAGPLASVELYGAGGWNPSGEILPGRDVAFWGEPYLPGHRLVWFEKRGFRTPVGASVVFVDGSGIENLSGLRLRLSSRAIETDAQLAILGITARRRGDHVSGATPRK